MNNTLNDKLVELYAILDKLNKKIEKERIKGEETASLDVKYIKLLIKRRETILKKIGKIKSMADINFLKFIQDLIQNKPNYQVYKTIRQLLEIKNGTNNQERIVVIDDIICINESKKEFVKLLLDALYNIEVKGTLDLAYTNLLLENSRKEYFNGLNKNLMEQKSVAPVLALPPHMENDTNLQREILTYMKYYLGKKEYDNTLKQEAMSSLISQKLELPIGKQILATPSSKKKIIEYNKIKKLLNDAIEHNTNHGLYETGFEVLNIMNKNKTDLDIIIAQSKTSEEMMMDRLKALFKENVSSEEEMNKRIEQLLFEITGNRESDIDFLLEEAKEMLEPKREVTETVKTSPKPTLFARVRKRLK